MSESANPPVATADADVRERIFQSALRQFSSKGYAATSLREIADDARTTKPMIYYYFGSKEGLYGSIVRQILEDMAASIRVHLDASRGFSEQVLLYCERYIDYFLAQEEIIALVLREVFGLGGASMDTFAEALGMEVRRPLDEVLRAGIEAGVFDTEHVTSSAAAITGIMNMFILAHVFGGAPIDRETPLQQVGYYVRGLERAKK